MHEALTDNTDAPLTEATATPKNYEGQGVQGMPLTNK
jgi:hypothetical protein